jgi:DNA polymerase-3 subunit alpha
MLVIRLGDGTATQEVTVYNELADQARGIVREDALLVIEARVRMIRRAGDEGEETFMRVSAEKLYDLAAARNKFARGIKLVCNGGSNGTRLRELLAPYRSGACPVWIEYSNQRAQCSIELGQEWRVRLDDMLVESLQQWLQPENVRIDYGGVRAT